MIQIYRHTSLRIRSWKYKRKKWIRYITKIFWAQTYREKQWKKQQQSIKDSSNSKQRFDEFENNEDNPLCDDYGYFKIHRYRSNVYDRDYNMKGKINKIYYSNNGFTNNDIINNLPDDDKIINKKNGDKNKNKKLLYLYYFISWYSLKLFYHQILSFNNNNIMTLTNINNISDFKLKIK